MPTYRFRCSACGDFEEWFSIKVNSSTATCRCGLSAVKVMTIPNISATVTPTRTAPEVTDALRRDRVMAADMDAYRRIRREGLQPKQIDGCAELEARANYRTEIEMGRRLPKHAVWMGSEMASEMMDKEVGELVRSQRPKETTDAGA